MPVQKVSCPCTRLVLTCTDFCKCVFFGVYRFLLPWRVGPTLLACWERLRILHTSYAVDSERGTRTVLTNCNGVVPTIHTMSAMMTQRYPVDDGPCSGEPKPREYVLCVRACDSTVLARKPKTGKHGPVGTKPAGNIDMFGIQIC
jgi:hypothetical protein